MVVRCDGETQPPQLYRGPDAEKHFLEELQEEESKIKEVCENPEPMCVTQEDRKSHENATHCHICNKPLEDDPVRGNCQYFLSFLQ